MATNEQQSENYLEVGGHRKKATFRSGKNTELNREHLNYRRLTPVTLAKERRGGGKKQSAPGETLSECNWKQNPQATEGGTAPFLERRKRLEKSKKSGKDQEWRPGTKWRGLGQAQSRF